MKEKRCQLRQHLIGRNVTTTEQVPYEHGDILLRNKFLLLFTRSAFGIRSASEAIFSLASIWHFSALKISLAKMASESAKPTSQNGFFTSL